MSQIDNIEIKTKDNALKELLETIVIFWNGGNVPFKRVTSVPTDSPSTPEMRLFESGSTFRAYYFFPGGTGWKYVNLS